ncbi:MAG TPA: pyruvate formate lyase family protein [Candidatus Limiplasma sp.]|nr:pyruvate formate lyase family protein [Candidatus Limiplasma sp.]
MAMPTYAQRINILTQRKHEYTAEKQRVNGAMDYDDHALILPPEEKRKLVTAISGSGMLINDVVFNDTVIKPNHPNGSFYGPLGQGENFRNFLLSHPPFIDPMSALAGAYMVNFTAYRTDSNPDLNYDALKPNIEKYQLVPGLLGNQHLCQDLQILLDLGLDGLRRKISKYRAINDQTHYDYYDALTMVVEGIQGWIMNNALEALRMSGQEDDDEIRAHLVHLYDMNVKLVHEVPETFEEACQLMLWMQMACRMYNGSASLGRLDTLLKPYYDRESAAGTLSDEDAVFYIACMLLRDTSYVQLGGYDEDGNDTTSKVSYLVLEAVHALRLPSNVGVSVGTGIDRELLRRSVEYQFIDKTGNPRFVGVESLVNGLVKNGDVPIEVARMRTNAGCHWLAIPGREFSLMDCVKINFAVPFLIALREAVAKYGAPTTDQIIAIYRKHLKVCIDTLAMGFDFTYDNQIHNCPELPLSLMCHGTIEKGLDASNGGVEFYRWCIDGSAIAVVADSLAAIEKNIIKECRYTYKELLAFLDNDWAGEAGEKARLFFAGTDKYGKGGTAADEYAKILSNLFTLEVLATRTPKHGFKMLPGLFSWAYTLTMGNTLGATPNGRKAGTPISHGANPNPGFRQDGAATAMSCAIASVQPGCGNTAPMQIELEPTIGREDGGVEYLMALIEDHFAKGGTLINMNIIDADKVRAAHKDPSLYPDLIVRVTGFSAYFASLSPAFRQLVVDRILDREIS